MPSASSVIRANVVLCAAAPPLALVYQWLTLTFDALLEFDEAVLLVQSSFSGVELFRCRECFGAKRSEWSADLRRYLYQLQLGH
jgi:hypothetical protein